MRARARVGGGNRTNIGHLKIRDGFPLRRCFLSNIGGISTKWGPISVEFTLKSLLQLGFEGIYGQLAFN